MTREHSHAESTSRWSSGSESEGEFDQRCAEVALKSRKSFLRQPHNSMAADATASRHHLKAQSDRQTVEQDASTRPGEAATQVLPVPTKTSVPSLSKRLLLNGLPSLRKKSFSNLSGQSAVPINTV